MLLDQETGPDLIPDESTMWGPRYNSLVTCPNSTTDFALLAQFVSTPFTHKIPFNSNFYQDQGTGTGPELQFWTALLQVPGPSLVLTSLSVQTVTEPRKTFSSNVRPKS